MFAKNVDTFFWKCPNKRNNTTTEDQNTTLKPTEDQNRTMKPSIKQIEEKLKCHEKVHVITYYMVEGSGNGRWDNIWYTRGI